MLRTPNGNSGVCSIEYVHTYPHLPIGATPATTEDFVNCLHELRPHTQSDLAPTGHSSCSGFPGSGVSSISQDASKTRLGRIDFAAVQELSKLTGISLKFCLHRRDSGRPLEDTSPLCENVRLGFCHGPVVDFLLWSSLGTRKVARKGDSEAWGHHLSQSAQHVWSMRTLVGLLERGRCSNAACRPIWQFLCIGPRYRAENTGNPYYWDSNFWETRTSLR